MRRVRARRSAPEQHECSQRHASRATKNAINANSVTCSPEIATRCVVPVALNTRHWSALRRSVSPTASAVEQRRGVRIGDLIVDARGHPRAQRVDRGVRQREPKVESSTATRCPRNARRSRNAKRAESGPTKLRVSPKAARAAPAGASVHPRAARRPPRATRAAQLRTRVAGAAVDERAVDIEPQLRAVTRRHRE